MPADLTAGTRVRLMDPPGSRVPFGTVGIALEAPNNSGQFWAQYPQGRMHTRTSEVQVLPRTKRGEADADIALIRRAKEDALGRDDHVAASEARDIEKGLMYEQATLPG